MSVAAVILAAGKGTRMCSKLPKVLHKVCDSTLVSWVMDAAREAGVVKTVVIAGFGAEQVVNEVSGKGEVALQEEQLGTAHALLQAAPLLRDFSGCILVLCGDTPLIEGDTLRQLVETHRSQKTEATLLTARVSDPEGYGRVIRDDKGFVERIVEQKDATAAEKQINEINTGFYCFNSDGLFDALGRISPANAQGEYYLTDIIDVYRKEGRSVAAIEVGDPREIAGINDRCQLAQADSYMRQRLLEKMMLEGVTIIDPPSTFISRKARVGCDTVIHPFTIIEGNTVVGEDCVLGPGARLINAVLGSGVTVEHATVLDSTVGDNCQIGPYAYIRPETWLGAGVKVGRFVEIKKSVIGAGSKVPHLSYVGDTLAGRDVNIGAGTITCNYDGSKKWLTRIGDGAFIGSNTNLVAPVEVGKGATVGAGSTITKDIDEGSLGVERAKQVVVRGWSKKKKD